MEQANEDVLEFYVDFSDFISPNVSSNEIILIQELILYSSQSRQKKTLNHFCKNFPKIPTFQ